MKRLFLLLMTVFLLAACKQIEARDTNMYKINISGVDINLEELIPDESINRLMADDLKLLEKYFYAKENMIFKDKSYQEYFSRYLWYAPKLDKKDIVFNEIELENLSKISERLAKISVNQDRIRIAMVYYDINGDGELEEILMDRWQSESDVKHVYDRIRIYHYDADQRDMIFNSEEVLGLMEGAYFEGSDQLLLIDDLNQNGLNEIYLQYHSNTHAAPRTTMLEYDGDVFKILFNEPFTDFSFVDLDEDGTLEFVGKFAEGLDDGFNPPVYKAYELFSGDYKYSEFFTQLYLKEICFEEREAFFINPSEKAFMRIISLYAMTNYYEEGLTFLENGYPYIEHLDREFDKDFYLILYEDQRQK